MYQKWRNKCCEAQLISPAPNLLTGTIDHLQYSESRKRNRNSYKVTNPEQYFTGSHCGKETNQKSIQVKWAKMSFFVKIHSICNIAKIIADSQKDCKMSLVENHVLITQIIQEQ